jgi:hypothetical protein
MKKMYKFIITATSPETQSIEKVYDLSLAIQIFHASAESGLFDYVDLVDSQTGEVHAHTCGEGEDFYLSNFLIKFMISDMERRKDKMLGQPEPQETPSDRITRMFAELERLFS